MRARALVGASIVFVVRAALAAEPACGARPWVRVVGAPDANVIALLRAELAGRGMDACPEGGTTKPIATVQLSVQEGRVDVDVEVRDAVTAKRVGRVLDLSRLPPDGRAMATALAIDELLRASWAELALPRAPPPAEPVPSAVARTVAEDRAAPPPLPAPLPRAIGSIGVSFALDHYAGGQTHVGADARAAAWIGDRVALTLRIGLRSGVAESAPDGEIRSSVLLGGAGAAFALTPRVGRAGLDAIARADALRVSFVATPRPGATASTDVAPAVVAAAGLQPWLALGSTLRLSGEVLVCDALVPARATDAQARVTGVSGVGVAFGLGAAGGF